MTYFTNRCLIAAAAFVVVAGSASAEVLKAEIPFSFRLGKAMMAPGTYRVFTGNGGRPIRLTNFEMKSNALVMATTKQDVAREWVESKVPKLAFDCVEGRCELAKIWDGSDRSAFMLPRAHRNGETAGVTTPPV